MRFITLFALLVVAGSAIAQSDFRPGYVITHSMDTLRGLIDHRGEIRNMKLCTYKESIGHTVKEFYPGDIYGYRFNSGKFYVSKHIDNKNLNDTVFVEFLLKGISNLYFYSSPTYRAYFIEPEGGDLVELRSEDVEYKIREGSSTVYIRKDKRYIGLLNYTFSDYPELQRKIANTKLSHKGLIQITRKYHEYKCDDESCIVYEKKMPVLKIQLLPFVGYTLDYYKSKGGFLEKFDFNNSQSFVGGLNLNFIVPRVNDRLSLFTTFQIKRQQFRGTFYQSTVYDEKKYVADISSTNILVSGGLKYTYPTGAYRPTAGIGIFKGMSLNGEGVITETRTINSIEVAPKKKPIEGVNTSSVGMVINVGGLILLEKITPFFNISFLSGKGARSLLVNEKAKTNEFTNSVQLTTGILF